jgi:hypothetical protein
MHVHSSTIAGTIFNPTILQSIHNIKSSCEQEPLRCLLSSVAIALAACHNTELVLRHFQQQLFIILGTSSLLYALHDTMQNLAQWMALHIASHHPEPQSLIETLACGKLSIRSSFHLRITPLMVYSLRTTRAPSQTQTSQAGKGGETMMPILMCYLLFDVAIWNHHPVYLFFTWPLGFTVGAMGLLPP